MSYFLNMIYDVKKEEFAIIKKPEGKRATKIRISYKDSIELKEWLGFAHHRLMK